jgi:hypothetical protein
MSNPETEPRSRTEQFLQAFRRMPLVRQVIPQEAGIGWPLPRRKDGKLYVIWPFYGFAPTARAGHTDLFPVFATVTVDWGTKSVVEFVDFRYAGRLPRDERPRPVGQFPHPAVAGFTVGEYRKAKGDLLALYDRLFEVLAAGGEFDPAFLTQFGELFARMLEPAFEQQYREIAAPFMSRFFGEKTPAK